MDNLTIKHQAMAGTLESSDVQVMIDGNDGKGLEIDLKSDVEKQYGRQIYHVIESTLGKLNIDDAKVVVVDRGALDCTIKARVIAAVYRAADVTENIDWEALV